MHSHAQACCSISNSTKVKRNANKLLHLSIVLCPHLLKRGAKLKLLVSVLLERYHMLYIKIFPRPCCETLHCWHFQLYWKRSHCMPVQMTSYTHDASTAISHFSLSPSLFLSLPPSLIHSPVHQFHFDFRQVLIECLQPQLVLVLECLILQVVIPVQFPRPHVGRVEALVD